MNTLMMYCNICDKTINYRNKSKRNEFKSLQHKEKVSVGVEEYQFIRPDKNKRDYVIINCAR